MSLGLAGRGSKSISSSARRLNSGANENASGANAGASSGFAYRYADGGRSAVRSSGRDSCALAVANERPTARTASRRWNIHAPAKEFEKAPHYAGRGRMYQVLE